MFVKCILYSVTRCNYANKNKIDKELTIIMVIAYHLYMQMSMIYYIIYCNNIL